MKIFDKAYKSFSKLPGAAQVLIAVGGLFIGWYGIAMPVKKAIQKKVDKDKETKAAADDTVKK